MGGDASGAQRGPASVLRLYRRESANTRLGRYAARLPELPRTVPELARTVRGLVSHHDELDAEASPSLGRARGEETIRTAEGHLELLLRKDDRSLAIPRPLENRTIGCCRDFAVLLCGFLRARSVPARVRVGFADYLGREGFADHAVCEYWSSEGPRWLLVDAQRIDLRCDPTRGGVDPLDVPRTRFRVAGEAWKLCREGVDAPWEFLVDPRQRGWRVLRPYVVLDLAALNGVEPLLWDRWGLGRPARRLPGTVEELALLDRAAGLEMSPDGRDSDIRRLYQNTPGLRAPARVAAPRSVHAA